MEESRVYVVSGSGPVVTKGKKVMEFLTNEKFPTLQKVIEDIQTELVAANIGKWSASITVSLTVGTGKIIPGGESTISATINIESKTA
jgi:hypothetical protein